MFNLVKYEFRKQAFSKLVIFVCLLAFELIYLFGILLDNTYVWGMSFTVLGIISVCALFYITFESIITFSNDLKTKNSYMLFLTPNTSFRIIGAKIISATIQVIFIGAAIVSLNFINISLIFIRYQTLEDFIVRVNRILYQITQVNVKFSDVMLVLLSLIIFWITMITISFLAITLSSTVFSAGRLKGLASIIIFFTIIFLIEYIATMTIGFRFDFSGKTSLWFHSLIYLVITGVTYISTALLLDKKVSL